MVRNRVAVELATPMSLSSTLFCATSMVICIRKPMPAPSTTIQQAEVKPEVSVERVDSSTMPAVITTVPMIG